MPKMLDQAKIQCDVLFCNKIFTGIGFGIVHISIVVVGIGTSHLHMRITIDIN